MRLPLLTALAVTIIFGTHVSAQGPNIPLAANVLKTIPVLLDAEDSFSDPMQIPGLQPNQYTLNLAPQNTTLFDSTRNVVFHRTVYQYEISVLGGLRQRTVKFRYPDGGEEKRNVWYLVYRVRDLGDSISYKRVEEVVETDVPAFTPPAIPKEIDVEALDEKVRAEIENPLDQAEFDSRLIPGSTGISFVEMRDVEKSGGSIDKNFRPSFHLEGWILNSEKQNYRAVKYYDIDSPQLVDLIRRTEDPNLLNKEKWLYGKDEIAKIDIPLSGNDDLGVWGVAIWDQVDPRLDYVSVKANGISNAYRVTANAEGKLEFKYKVLQMNFWRPGDALGEDRDEVDFGIPLVDQPREQVEILRRYDIPGPLVRGYVVNPSNNGLIRLMEIDGQVNLEDFNSALVPKLDASEIPEEVRAGFASAGINVGNGNLNADIPGRKWSFQQNGATYVIQYEPQFWRRKADSIEFIESVDHFWIYR